MVLKLNSGVIFKVDFQIPICFQPLTFNGRCSQEEITGYHSLCDSWICLLSCLNIIQKDSNNVLEQYRKVHYLNLNGMYQENCNNLPNNVGVQGGIDNKMNYRYCDHTHDVNSRKLVSLPALVTVT